MGLVRIQIIVYLVIALLPGKAQIKQFDKFADVVVLHYPDSAFLVAHEITYRPIEGNYVKGNESTVGNRESRLSVYNLMNGRLVAQKELEMKDSLTDAFFLGGSASSIWIYWNKYKSGLQALNPRTLERTLSMGQLYGKISPPVGLLVDPFPKPLYQHFAYEPVKQRLVVTNREGKMFYVNTSDFVSSPIVRPMNFESKRYYFNNNFTLGHLSFQIDPSGNNYLYVEDLLTGKTTETKTGLLELVFLMEQDPIKLHRHFMQLDSAARCMADGPENLKRIQDIKQNLDAAENRLATENVPLLCRTDRFLAVYKTSIEPDAAIGIASISCSSSGECVTQWQLPLSGMFYNVRTAQNSATYKKMFSQNQPDSEFRFFYLLGHQLIVVYLQQIACVDIVEGKLLWIRRL